MAYDAVDNLNDLDATRPDGATETGSILDDVDRETRRVFKSVIQKSHTDDGTIKDDTITGSMVKDNALTTQKYADDSVNASKINVDVAGVGLKQNPNGSLSPDVDDATIEVSGNSLQVKSIPGSKLTDASVNYTKLAAAGGNAYLLIYNQAALQWQAHALSGDISVSETGAVTVNNSPALNLPTAILAETVTGGLTQNTWNTRDLNLTVLANAFMTPSASGFKLNEGDYIIVAQAAGNKVDDNQLRLFNSTQNTTVLSGLAAQASVASTIASIATLQGKITVSDSNDVYLLQHNCTTTNGADGRGIVPGFAGAQPMVASIMIIQV
ncbi:MAG: hypothetical protein K1X66_02350 [Verrucomicrobiae bacterium]|nr:hypothetical protein [Verrucomicrobiae bacterium]